MHAIFGWAFLASERHVRHLAGLGGMAYLCGISGHYAALRRMDLLLGKSLGLENRCMLLLPALLTQYSPLLIQFVYRALTAKDCSTIDSDDALGSNARISRVIFWQSWWKGSGCWLFSLLFT